MCKISPRLLIFTSIVIYTTTVWHLTRWSSIGDQIDIGQKVISSKPESDKGSKLLLVMVVSTPENRGRRDIIRKTWAKSYVEQGKKFDVKFAVGTIKQNLTLLLSEENEFGDMIFLTDVLESYEELTRKVLHAFVWADRNTNYSYILKVDDDSFPKLDQIEKELKARTSKKALYWGYILTDAIPQNTGRWAEPNWDLCPHYLPYALGGGYIISQDLIHRIVKNADGLKLYRSEDVSVGAWISSFDLERKYDERFNAYPEQQWVGNKQCKKYLLIHHLSIQDMKNSHNLMHDSNTLC